MELNSEVESSEHESGQQNGSPELVSDLWGAVDWGSLVQILQTAIALDGDHKRYRALDQTEFSRSLNFVGNPTAESLSYLAAAEQMRKLSEANIQRTAMKRHKAVPAGTDPNSVNWFADRELTLQADKGHRPAPQPSSTRMCGCDRLIGDR